MLYIIYTNDFSHIFNPNIKVLQYADDVCIYTTESNIEKSHDNLEIAVQQVDLWTSDNGLTISESKSAIVTFTRKRYQPPRNLKLHNHTIPYKSSEKFLGMFLDSKLNWKQHINYICSRSEKSINIIKVFSKHKWGADPNICLLFYKSFVRSILDYGCVLYGSAANIHLNKVNLIQNKCLRLCIGYLRTTPINIIEAECCEPPLYLRREFLSNKLTVKIISQKRELLDKIHKLTIQVLTSKYWQVKKSPLLTDSYQNLSHVKELIYSEVGLPDYTTYDKPLKILTANVFSDIPAAVRNRIFINNINSRWKNHDYIFTDGSLLNGKTGSAYFHVNQNIKAKFKLPEGTSIFTAELVAIRETLTYCMNLSLIHI